MAKIAKGKDLPEVEKRTIALRMWLDGMTFVEIAAELGIGIAEVRKWYEEDMWEDVKESLYDEVRTKMMDVLETYGKQQLELLTRVLDVERLVFSDLIKLADALDRLIKETDGDLSEVKLNDIKKYNLMHNVLKSLLDTVVELREKYILKAEEIEGVEETIVVELQPGGVAEVKKEVTVKDEEGE